MSTLQQTLPPLINGVSQQPDSLMAPGTLRRCDNFLPDPVWGLAKRPGSELINTTEVLEEGSWFNISLSENEDFLIFVGRSGNIRIWDADSGIPQQVTVQATNYAAHQSQEDVEVLQLGDITFLLNRTQRVGKSTEKVFTQVKHAWIELNSISYDTQYKVTVRDGSTSYTATYTTPSSGVISVDSVLNGIRNALIAVLPGLPNGIGVSDPVGNVIRFNNFDWPTNDSQLVVDASGGLTGSGLKGYSGSVNSVADLPSQYFAFCPVFVKTNLSTGDGYWVEMKLDPDQSPPGETRGSGVWVEVAKPDEQFRVIYNTMPHGIVRRADGTWEVRPFDGANPLPESQSVAGRVTSVSPLGPYLGKYGIGQVISLYGGSGKQLKISVTSTDNQGAPLSIRVVNPGYGYTGGDVVTALNGDKFAVSTVASQTVFNPSFANQAWLGRTVGDTTSVPWPSFVDSTITGIGFFLNRLVLMSGDNVITSKAGDYFNFWPTSAIQVLDDDPVDLNAGSSTLISFRHAVPYNRQLVLVSEDYQYALRTRDEAFSPASAELSLISNVKTSTAVRPIKNQLAWFVTEDGPGGVKFYEMFPGADEDPNLGKPQLLNIQAPSYIPRFVFSSDADPDAGILACVSEQQKSSIYIWRWTDSGRQRIQSAWFRYVWSGDIKHIYMLDDYMYVVSNYSNTTILSRVRLSVTDPQGLIEFEGSTFSPRIDLQVYPSSISYDEITGTASISIAGTVYEDMVGDLVVYITDGPKAGVFTSGTINGDQLEINEDPETDNLIVGLPFEAFATLPNMYVRGERSEVVFPPKVRRMRFRAFNSGAFEVQVEAVGRAPFIKNCDLKTPSNYILNSISMFRVAQASVPIMADGDRVKVTIQAPDPLPTNIQEVTWQGTYATRGISPR